jgi:hypothetical protein
MDHDMSPDYIEETVTTAAEMRDHLVELEAERSLSRTNGLADVASYSADLEEEIEVSRRLYVAIAVSEIATLRAELSGPLVG